MKNAIIVGLLLVVLGVLGFAALKPDKLNIQRSILIKAGPEKIAPYIDDFHKWAEWSPFEKLDPAMKKSFTGPAAGKGSMFNWSGNKMAGEGQMEIIESGTDRVFIQQVNSKPMRSKHSVEFKFTPGLEGSTIVTWSINGKNSFVSKLSQVFMNMDKMMGNVFDEGLAKLKEVVEKEAAPVKSKKK